MVKNEFVRPTQISKNRKNNIDNLILDYKKATTLNKAV